MAEFALPETSEVTPKEIIDSPRVRAARQQYLEVAARSIGKRTGTVVLGDGVMKD